MRAALLTLAAHHVSATSTAACPNQEKADQGKVCKCTAESCGVYPDPRSLPEGGGHAMIVTSRADDWMNIRFMEPEIKQMENAGTATNNPHMKFDIEANSVHQSVLGFGGAFTDASAYVYSQLTPDAQAQFVKQYWGADGIGYSMGRVPMNAADFSRMEYTMTEPDDFELESFCLRDDTSAKGECGKDYKATLILAAQDAAQEAGNALRVFTSTWSAAPWYKTQNFTCQAENGVSICEPGESEAMTCSKTIADSSTCHDNQQCERCPELPTTKTSDVRSLLSRRDAHSNVASSLDKSLCTKTKAGPTAPTEAADGNCFHTGFLKDDPTIRQSWANYFSKFISAYKTLGINLWGLTVQNEPLTQTGLWQSMFFTPETQAEFVAQYLGPTIRRDHPEMKIMIHDDATIELLTFAKGVLENEEASQYVDGVAYHWYNTLQASFENTETGGFPLFGIDIPVGNLLGGGKDVQTIYDQVQAQSSDKFVLMTEACSGFAIGTDWVGPRHGEWGYGYSYSHDILWQLRNSGSGWIDWNLILDNTGGPNIAGNFVDSPMYKKDDDDSAFYQNPSFFHMAHFSKYIPAGSKRVDFNVECGARHPEWCQAVSFLRPDGLLAIVFTNDEITVGPIAGGGAGLGISVMPLLAQGEGSLTLGNKELRWVVSCGDKEVSGTLPWKSIQTVIMDCGFTTV